MKRLLLAFTAVLIAFALAMKPASAEGLVRKHQALPACEPGYQIIEEIVYQEVSRTVCKQIQETKKKWVYSMIDDPFCIQDSKHGACPDCKGPLSRKLLVKRQVDVACPTTKCVTETITERVPVIVYRKVPCLPFEPTPPKK